MPLEDARRWDERYTTESRYRGRPEPREWLTIHESLLPPEGLALDVAMGLGQNAAYLLGRGISTIGVDISGVALQKAIAYTPGLMLIQADLSFPPFSWRVSGIFDVILNFYFLDRDLWTLYARWLKPGGLLFFETLTKTQREYNPEMPPNYLLSPGELLHAFAGMETLDYREGTHTGASDKPRASASLLARKSV